MNMCTASLFLLLLLLPSAAAQTADPAALARGVSTYEYGQDRAPLDAFSDAIRASHSNPTLRGQLETALLDLLRGNSTNAGKDFACRALSEIGGDASVPALAALLSNPALSSIALYALERIPGKQSTAALTKALAESPEPGRIALINALARRGDSSPLFRKWLAAPESGLAAAAATAVGITGAAADIKPLLAARTSNPAAREAALRLAERLGPAGRPVYVELYRPSEPVMTRVAALQGLARLDGPKALPSVLDALKSSDAPLQREAVALAARLGGHAQLLNALTAQSPAMRVVTITALSEAGATGALPAFRASAQSDDPSVRVAAIRALGRNGQAEDALFLAKLASQSEEAVRDEARSALSRLRGAPVDAAIVKAIPSSGGKEQVELIRAVSERGIADAVPSLLECARSTDRDIRRESIRALRDIAPAEVIPNLVSLLAASPAAADRRETERTLASALRRNPQAPLTTIQKELEGAQSADARASLLSVLGQSTRDDALPILRAALSNAEPAARRAAILALTEWPTITPAGDLLSSAKSDSEPPLRILALRGYIRLVSAPSERQPAVVAKQLAEALSASPQPDEKRAVLAALTRFVCPESLEVAKTLLSDPSVSQEAKSAVERIEHAIPFRR